MLEIINKYLNDKNFEIPDDLYHAIVELEDKYSELHRLIQGDLYDEYLYYKQLASYYQGDCVSKKQIREIFQFYIERDSLFNDDPHKMAVITLKNVLKELLEENTNE